MLSQLEGLGTHAKQGPLHSFCPVRIGVALLTQMEVEAAQILDLRNPRQ
jgi:hypothetical protein